MNDQAINLVLTYLAATGVCTYLLQALQKWSKTPWITEHTHWINFLVRAALSLSASLGMHWAWATNPDHSHVLTIAIPSALDLVKGLVHWVGQYFAQHVAGNIVTLSAPKQDAGKAA